MNTVVKKKKKPLWKLETNNSPISNLEPNEAGITITFYRWVNSSIERS